MDFVLPVTDPAYFFLFVILPGIFFTLFLKNKMISTGKKKDCKPFSKDNFWRSLFESTFYGLTFWFFSLFILIFLSSFLHNTFLQTKFVFSVFSALSVGFISWMFHLFLFLASFLFEKQVPFLNLFFYAALILAVSSSLLLLLLLYEVCFWFLLLVLIIVLIFVKLGKITPPKELDVEKFKRLVNLFQIVICVLIIGCLFSFFVKDFPQIYPISMPLEFYVKPNPINCSQPNVSVEIFVLNRLERPVQLQTLKEMDTNSSRPTKELWSGIGEISPYTLEAFGNFSFTKTFDTSDTLQGFLIYTSEGKYPVEIPCDS